MSDDRFGACEFCGGFVALRGDDLGCNCEFCHCCYEFPIEGWADYCQECINDMEDEEFERLVMHRSIAATPDETEKDDAAVADHPATQGEVGA